MDLKFNQNEDRNKLLLSDLRRKLNEVYLGGGKAKIAKQNVLIIYLIQKPNRLKLEPLLAKACIKNMVAALLAVLS